MIKKLALGVACLGLLFSTTSGWGCNGDDICKVDKPKQIVVGYDIKVDLDICIDPGTLNDDYWDGVNAFILQNGKENYAVIDQPSTDNKAGIIQSGDSNEGYIYQEGKTEVALILQDGNHNYGYIWQGLEGANALIIQSGNKNTAEIYQ